MGLSIDEFHFCLSRIRHHFLLFLTQNPVIAGLSLFMFIIYTFLPSVFRVLLHSFPIFVMIVLAIKLSLDRKKISNVTVVESEPQENNSLPESPMSGSGEKTYKRAHSVRRRNAKLKEHFNNINLIQQDKEVAAAATSNNEDVVDKVALTEEVSTNTKEIREVKREIETASLEIPKGKNKEDDEIDDEKNSMDIAGLSEAERNGRLESLMAKRRARKMLSIQLRRALVKMGKNDPRAQFASILIPKSIPSVPTSPTPNCAPCVLFPSRNPFDIPYDSHEEKPNLSEDGFQKEFVPNQSKDSPTLIQKVEEDHDTKQMLPNELSNVTNDQQEMIKDAIFITSPESSSSSSKIETIHIKDDTENINIPSPQAPNNDEKGIELGLFTTSKEDCHTSIDSDSQVEVSGTTPTNPHSDHEKPSSSSDINNEGSREVHELREQDIMDVVFSGLEPIYEPDLEEHESPTARGSISMINHDHQPDKCISTEQSRKGKSIAEENNNTYETDDIPNNNGKEIIDYIKDTYEEQPSYEPSSSSSNSNKNNESEHVNEINQQKEFNPFAASSSHSNIIENETNIDEQQQQQQQQQDLQQEMVVGEGSYDSSSSSSSTSRSSNTHDDKIIQTDQNSSNFDKPTNETIPKSDQSTGTSLITSISNSPQNEIQTDESSPTEFNLQIGSRQTSTQETIPCSKDEIETIKEEEDS